jgi:hypothetical protein
VVPDGNGSRFVGKQLGYERPLIHAHFRTDGVRLFLEQADRILEVSGDGQVILQEARFSPA